jgi:KxDL motif-containing protein 1
MLWWAHRLAAFRKTNLELTTFNDYSARRYATVAREFEAHTRMLVAMKADLDAVFRRIRTLQAKLSKQYPQAFAEVAQV